MPTLGELARLIRSKNAGAFTLTFDIMFETEDAYRKVLASTAEMGRTSVGRPAVASDHVGFERNASLE